MDHLGFLAAVCSIGTFVIVLLALCDAVNL